MKRLYATQKIIVVSGLDVNDKQAPLAGANIQQERKKKMTKSTNEKSVKFVRATAWEFTLAESKGYQVKLTYCKHGSKMYFVERAAKR